MHYCALYTWPNCSKWVPTPVLFNVLLKILLLLKLIHNANTNCSAHTEPYLRNKIDTWNFIDYRDETWASFCCSACYALCVEVLVLYLTRVDKFESFSGGLGVWVKLQPQMVGCADKSQAQHCRTCEGSQHMGCVVFTIIDLQGIKNNT